MVNKSLMQEATNRLVKVYDPLKIYLFGSYAWGHPDEESDVDLLIIVDKSEEKIYKRAIHAFDPLYDLDLSTDILVLTREEFEQRADNITTLYYKIKRQGKIVYAKA